MKLDDTPRLDGYLLTGLTEDGRIGAIAPLTFGRARIVIGNQHWVDDAW